MGELIGTANVSKNGLLSKNIYASKFRSKEVLNGKVVSFVVPRYTRGALRLSIVSTQNTISFTECIFIVDMNTGKPKVYNAENFTVKYIMQEQYDKIYMKFNFSSACNIYLNYAENLNDQYIFDIEVLDDFPSEAVSL